MGYGVPDAARLGFPLWVRFGPAEHVGGGVGARPVYLTERTGVQADRQKKNECEMLHTRKLGQ